MVAIDYAKLRENMVEGQIRTADVTSVAVIDAFRAVPREQFVPEPRRPFAYIDEDLAVGASGRCLMAPAPLAKLVQLAAIGPGDRILTIGAATGYTAAVLSRLAGSVVALESDAELVAEARRNLAALECGNVEVVEGSLSAGHDKGAPYDVILLEGATDLVPEQLFRQLADGGRLVAVIGRGNTGMATLWTASAEGLSRHRAFNAAVAVLPGFERTPFFEF